MRPHLPRYLGAEADHARMRRSAHRAEALRLLAACLAGALAVATLWTCSVHRKQVLHIITFHRNNQTLIIATP